MFRMSWQQPRLAAASIGLALVILCPLPALSQTTPAWLSKAQASLNSIDEPALRDAVKRALAEAITPEQQTDLHDFLIGSVDQLWDTDYHALRISLALQAVDLAVGLYGADSPRVVPAHSAARYAYSGAKDWRHAERHLREILLIHALSPVEVDDNGDVVLLESLGRTLLADGRPAEATPYLRAAVNGWRARLEPWHIALEPRMRLLADALLAMGDVTAAEAMYREAGAILLATHGADHSLRVRSLVDMALFLRDTDRPEEAQQFLIEAQRVLESHISMIQVRDGADEPYQQPVWLGKLADVLVLLGETEQATEMHRQALAVTRARLGDENPNTRDAANAAITHLRRHAPDAPELPELEAIFPQE